MRRFPPPWTIERLPGGFKVIDASGQSLAYFYARASDLEAPVIPPRPGLRRMGLFT